MLHVYASWEELGEWINPVPDEFEAKQLLRAASELVRKATRFDEYPVTPAGFPSDAFDVSAFRDATCAQVAEWDEAGINPNAGKAGQPAVLASSSINGASTSFETASQVAAQEASLDCLGSRGLAILQNSGLGSSFPRAE
ncbi:hypothetical protein CH289_07670 [Rhodococcus sp. RS1C4]|nr:hypothetical protein [Rhodococcus sp. RS1C4]OZC55064.1 hypothetical protein CH289_07670 [Rhodococcus sp. RS1C4]